MNLELLYLIVPSIAIITGMGIAINKIIKELTDVIRELKYFITKYKVFFMNGDGKKDYLRLENEIDQALESIADLLDKFKLKKYSKILREAIK